MGDEKVYELCVRESVGFQCCGKTDSSSFVGEASVQSRSKQNSIACYALTCIILLQKDAQRVIEAAQRQDLAIAVPQLLLSLFVEMVESQSEGVKPRLSRVSEVDERIKNSEWYNPGITRMESANAEGFGGKASTHTSRDKGKGKDVPGKEHSQSKERIGVAFAFDEGESEVEEDQLIDDDVPEEPKITRKGKPERAERLTIKLKPPSKRFTERGRNPQEKKLQTGRKTPVPVELGDRADSEEETTPKKPNKGKGKEVVRPRNRTSKEADRQKKGKGKEVERSPGQVDEGEEEDSGACVLVVGRNEISDLVWDSAGRPKPILKPGAGPAKGELRLEEWMRAMVRFAFKLHIRYSDTYARICRASDALLMVSLACSLQTRTSYHYARVHATAVELESSHAIPGRVRAKKGPLVNQNQVR